MLAQLPTRNWNYSTAAHLLNRAAFGGPPAEMERLADLGLERAVSQLVDFDRITDATPDPEWAKPNPKRGEEMLAMRRASEEERRLKLREEQRLQRARVTDLRGWWLPRLATGPRPLQEKMALFWHGHFATSVEKVRDAYLLWRQNELFRRLAVGNWRELLVEVEPGSLQLARLVLIDRNSARSDFLFSNVRENAPVNETQFAFKAPAGVQVVQQ